MYRNNRVALLGTAALAQLPFLLAAESDLSFDEIYQRLDAALLEQFGRDSDSCQRFYVYQGFPEYVIARGPEAALYRIPYSISGETVKFGEAQEVETAFVPVSEACEFVATEANATDDGTYPIVIIKPGWAGGAINGAALPHYYTPEFCRMVAEAAQGVPFGRKHPDQKGPDPTGALDAERIAGVVTNGTFDGVAKGRVKLFSAEADLRSRLNEARSGGNLGIFGVSMLASVAGKPGKIEGRDALVIDKLGTLYSIDLCQRAGAGGGFLAAASFAGHDIATAQQAAVKPNSRVFAPTSGQRANPGEPSAHRPGARMNPTLKKLLDALMKKDAAKAAPFFSRAVLATEAEQKTMEDEVLVALSEDPAAATTTVTAAEAATAALAELNRAQSRNRIEQKLTDSKLGEPAKKLVRAHLEERLVAEANLADASIDREIASTREAFAAFENVGRKTLSGVVLDGHDKIVLATEAMLGVTASKGQGVPAFRGIREAYVTITGDADLSQLISGGFTGNLRVAEAVASSDFPNILLNAMHKKLQQVWAELGLNGLEAIYTVGQPLNDYKSQDRVRDGFFGELPIVNENAAYQEMTKPTDEKVSYTPQKRGGLLTISEETIRNDDLGAVARWPDKLARAGRNTLRTFIVNFLINNPTYQADSLAIFHASHNNVGTDAFGQQGLINAQLKLRRQQEKDSNEYLGLPLSWIAVPPELEAAAIQLNQSETAGSDAFFHRFGANNERIFVVAKLTDTNDWYYGTDATLAPFLEVAFMDGKQEPEILLANQPTVGTMFTNDQIQYKSRFIFGGTFTDFRGVGKNVVP